MKSAVVMAVVCIGAAVTWYVWRPEDAPRDEVLRPEPVELEKPAPSTPSARQDAAPPVPASPRSDDPVQMQEDRLAFHARVRAFFAQAPAMDEGRRRKAAADLDAQIVVYEDRGELSAGEALLLRSALVRESVNDPRAQLEQIGALERQYQVESDQRRAAWAAQRDPMFELYKLREAAIVTNVMAMTEIPGGLSRNEYLRRRLQEERELLFDGG